MKKKGQFAGPVLGLITAAITLIIATIVFQQVFLNTGNAQLAPYSTGLTFNDLNVSTTLTGFLPIIPGTEVVSNCTAGQTLVGTGDDADYTIEYDTGNLTLINRSEGINTSCALDIFYRMDRGILDSTSQLINTTTYGALDLVTVGLIILAAVLVLSLVFLLGRRA